METIQELRFLIKKVYVTRVFLHLLVFFRANQMYTFLSVQPNRVICN